MRQQLYLLNIIVYVKTLMCTCACCACVCVCVCVPVSLYLSIFYILVKTYLFQKEFISERIILYGQNFVL